MNRNPSGNCGKVGAENGNWKGGKTVNARGYVLIRVGIGHPMSDVRGYAYEHRLIASEMLGRPLGNGEIVHHRNGIKKDNRPANLEVLTSKAEHGERHRERELNKRKAKEPNPTIKCKCGCGIKLRKYDSSNRPREFVSGHNPIASPTMDKVLEALKSGPLTRREIAEQIDKPMRPVATALSKMKAKGLIEQIKHGTWKLRGGALPP